MNCQQIDKLILDYCDDRLSPEIGVEIEQHLERCEECRKNVQLTRLESQVLRQDDDIPDLSLDFTDKIMNDIREKQIKAIASAERYKYNKGIRKHLGAVVAAAVILLAICIPSLLSMSNNIQFAEAPDTSESSNKSSQAIQHVDEAENDFQFKQAPDTPTQDSGFIASTEDESALVDESSHQNNHSDKELSNETQLPPSQGKISTVDVQPEASSAKPNYYYDGYTTEPNTPYKLAADTTYAAGTAQKSTLHSDMLALRPTNLPESYSLNKIINTSPDQVVYEYNSSETNKWMQISIGVETYNDLSDDACTDLICMSEPNFLVYRDSGSSRGEQSEIKQFQIVVHYQEYMYNIDVSSNMPLSELEELAELITFEEATFIKSNN